MGRLIILIGLCFLLISSVAPAQSDAGQMDRIGVRVVDGIGEFYNTRTTERFIIRGPNYHHLGLEKDYIVDKLFTPSHFDAAQVAADLRAMRELGYNTVRTSLDICRDDCVTEPNGGIRAVFLDNIATFIRLAHDEGLYVILTSNDFPPQSKYTHRMEAQCCSVFDGYVNTHYLAPVGLDTWKEYWQAVIRGLIERDAPLDAILAYSVRGEMWLFADQPPLSLTRGQVTTANGVTYDMADPAQRQAMVDEGAVYWLNELRAAVHELHPDVLVTVGVFPGNEPNNWLGDDARLVVPISTLARSDIDFFDLHPYPGYLPLADLIENYHLEGLRGQPITLLEFGAFKFAFPTPAAGALGLRSWQIDSCRYPFQGWMHWHWTGTNDHEVWTGTEGDGVINAILAPTNRPDPCVVGDVVVPGENIAFGATARASSTLPGDPASDLVDGTGNAWNAGAGAPQWVEMGWDKPVAVERVRLHLSQDPAGHTHHQVWAILQDGTLVLLGEFNQFTRGGEILTLSLDTPLSGVVGIRVDTLASPSWVSWNEIEVFQG